MKMFCHIIVGVFMMSQASAELSAEETEKLSSMDGHLKPLGSVGPFFDLYTVEGFPSTKDFFNKYVIPSTPLIMKNAAKLSPAFTKWSDEYFINHPQSAKTQVFAEGRKKEVRTEPGYTMSFKKFVQTYNKSDVYMVNGVPKHLRGDVLMPAPLLCEPVIDALLDTVTWFSSGGTKSVLHNDDVDNINCLFRGKKTLIFLNPHDSDQIGKTLIDHPEGSYSSMDVDAVDYTQFPILAKSRYARVHMEAGDCLFIPFKWYHQVNSFGSNLAVNLWWNHKTADFLDLTDEICGDFTGRDTLANFSYPGMEGENLGEEEEEEGEEPPEGAEEGFDEEDQELVNDEDVPLEKQEGVTKIDSQAGPYISPEEDSIVDRIFRALTKVKTKTISINGLKKWMFKKYPESIQNWDTKCQELLMNFYDALDQNKDSKIDIADAEMFYDADKKTMAKLQDIAGIFQDDLMNAMQKATFDIEKKLIKKLVDRGDLETDQIEKIFGEQLSVADMKRDEL